MGNKIINQLRKYALIRYFFYLAHISVVSTRRFFVEEYSYRASALAYTTLLALVPFLAVFLFLIAMFPIFSDFIYLAEGYILKNFIPTAALSVEKYFQGFIFQASHLPMISILFLFITALLLMNTIEETLNDIWQVKKRRKKWWSFLFCWIVMLLMPIIVGVSAFLSVNLFSLSFVVGFTDNLGITALIIFCLPTLINAFLFALLYKILPNVKVAWRHAAVGGIVAAILFELARFIFSIYITQFQSYEIVYGAFATIPIFLLWLYISWFIVLFGGFIAHAHAIH